MWPASRCVSRRVPPRSLCNVPVPKSGECIFAVVAVDVTSETGWPGRSWPVTRPSPDAIPTRVPHVHAAVGQVVELAAVDRGLFVIAEVDPDTGPVAGHGDCL